MKFGKLIKTIQPDEAIELPRGKIAWFFRGLGCWVDEHCDIVEREITEDFMNRDDLDPIKVVHPMVKK